MPNLIESTVPPLPSEPLAFISHASQDYEFANGVRRCLEDTDQLTVFLARTSIYPGQIWPNEIVQSLDRCIFFIPIISKHTRSAYYQQSEIVRAINSIKDSGDTRKIIPLILEKAPLPLGLEQCQNIEIIDHDTDLWCTQLCNTILSSPTIQGAPYDLEFWRRKLTESNLSILAKSLSIWLWRMSKRRELIETALGLIDTLKECLAINTEKSYRAHLTHTNRILTYMQKLCLSSSEGGFEKEPADFIIQEPGDYFVAGLAAVFHNLCLLAKIPSMARDPKDYRYVDRAAHFWDRMAVLKDLVLRDIDARGRSHVEQAFRVALEMYRDSPYWQHAACAHPEEVKDQDNWRAGRSRDRVGIIARALRRCDAFDVGHRLIPDLVLHLFTRFDYPDGLTCYLEHTFATLKPLLLMDAPELTRNGLLIRWADFRDPTKQEVPAIWKAVSLAHEIVEDELRTILREIGKEGDTHSNLDVAVRTLREHCSPTAERLDHVSWALFTLAVAEESSDTNAALTAANLVPLLVQYINQIASNITNSRERNRHIRTQTSKLLSLLPSLRSNSSSLRSVVEAASSAIRGAPPKSYAQRIRKAMTVWIKNNPGDANRATIWGDSSSEASLFVVYGASKPVARWLAASASKRQGGSLRVQPLYCMRRFLLDDAIRPGLQALAPRAEHDSMVDELSEAMQLMQLTRSDLDIAREPVDLRFLPTLAIHKEQSHQMEALFGARAFIKDQSGVWSVSIYGSNALTILCKGLGVPVRIITWEKVLRSPIRKFDRRDQPERLLFSYSVTVRLGSEDELVSLRDISCITTEKRSYTPQEAIRIIASATQRGAANSLSHKKKAATSVRRRAVSGDTKRKNAARYVA